MSISFTQEEGNSPSDLSRFSVELIAYTKKECAQALHERIHAVGLGDGLNKLSPSATEPNHTVQH